MVDHPRGDDRVIAGEGAGDVLGVSRVPRPTSSFWI